MKKILFLVTQSEFGGAQKYIIEMISGLENYEILVAAGDGNGELFEKLKKYPVKNVGLKWLTRTPLPLKSILSIKEIYDVLKTEKPDILFLCSTTAGLLGSIAACFYRIQFQNLKVI